MLPKVARKCLNSLTNLHPVVQLLKTLERPKYLPERYSNKQNGAPKEIVISSKKVKLLASKFLYAFTKPPSKHPKNFTKLQTTVHFSKIPKFQRKFSFNKIDVHNFLSRLKVSTRKTIFTTF